MAKKKQSVPEYGTVTRKGTLYYRTRITDADGKQVSLYATTCEELYEKQLEGRRQVEEIIFRRKHPTVAEYCEKWLLMQSAKVSTATIKGYRQNMKNYVINSLGDMYMEEVTADDIRLALVPLSQKSKGLYDTVNMLIKCVFYSAERSQLITDNPCVGISAKGGKASKKKDALTDQQVAVLLDTVKELPPYLFIMIGLYSGLRREEILALQWDCVFLDESTPYISVRRAWRAEHNRPVISTVLKTKAAKRDIPIPKCLVDCLREAKANSISEYVIADSEGQPLSYSQFTRVWQYVVVRSAKERTYYKYVNGQSIKYTVKPTLGTTQRNNPKIRYTLNFDVTPHLLRHPYVKHTTKIFSLRLMDFQAQAYPDARRKTRGACQLLRVGQSRSPVRPLCNRKRFSCLPPQSKMSWILYAISMRLSGYTSTRSISSSASSVVSVSASKIALDASFRLSCRACSSCFCFACANTAA